MAINLFWLVHPQDYVNDGNSSFYVSRYGFCSVSALELVLGITEARSPGIANPYRRSTLKLQHNDGKANLTDVKKYLSDKQDFILNLRNHAIGQQAYEA